MNNVQDKADEGQSDQAQLSSTPTKLAIGTPEQNFFWVVLVLLIVFGLDAAFRLSDLWEQRNQLDRARLAQAQNLGSLVDGQQAQARLQMLSLDLLQMATTNETAKKIVQEFNIKFSPTPVASPPQAVSISTPAAQTNTPPMISPLLSAPSNAQLASTNLLPLPSNLPSIK